jgi:hypothetical protein
MRHWLWAVWAGFILAPAVAAQTTADSMAIGAAVLDRALADAKRQGDGVTRLSIPRPVRSPVTENASGGHRLLVLAAPGTPALLSEAIPVCPWSPPVLHGSVAVGAELLSLAADTALVRVTLLCNSGLREPRSGRYSRPFLWLFRHTVAREGGGWRVTSVEELGIS